MRRVSRNLYLIQGALSSEIIIYIASRMSPKFRRKAEDGVERPHGAAGILAMKGKIEVGFEERPDAKKLASFA